MQTEFGLIDYQNDMTLVRPFPISIDFDSLDAEARSPEVISEMARLTQKSGWTGDASWGWGSTARTTRRESPTDCGRWSDSWKNGPNTGAG